MNESALQQWLTDTNRRLRLAECQSELAALQVDRLQSAQEILLGAVRALDEKLEQIRLILEHRDG